VHYEKARGFYGEDAIPFEAWLKEKDGKFVWQIRDIEDCQPDQVLGLKKGGLSQRDIAQATGMSPATVNRRLKDAQIRGIFDA
jgi:putative DNA primase/helicase